MAGFVLGFPGETDQTIRENANFIEESGVEFHTLKEFYYMKHTPIYRQREKFGLTGMGNKWQHKTMSHESIYPTIINLFKTIKTSVFTDADTSLWYIAYLYDQGYTVSEIIALQREINTVIQDQIEGNYNDDHPAFSRIQYQLGSVCDHVAP